MYIKVNILKWRRINHTHWCEWSIINNLLLIYNLYIHTYNITTHFHIVVGSWSLATSCRPPAQPGPYHPGPYHPGPYHIHYFSVTCFCLTKHSHKHLPSPNIFPHLVTFRLCPRVGRITLFLHLNFPPKALSHHKWITNSNVICFPIVHHFVWI